MNKNKVKMMCGVTRYNFDVNYLVTLICFN